MTDAFHTLLWYCFQYRVAIEVATLVTAIAIATPLILIRFFCGPRAAWAGWLGAAMGAFAPLYVVRMVEQALEPWSLPISVGLAMSSSLGDWCFLEATWRLKCTEPVPWRWRAVLAATFAALITLSHWRKDRPVLYQSLDTILSVGCIYAIARALVANLGASPAEASAADRSLGPGRTSLLVRGAARWSAVISVCAYSFAYLVFTLHPLFTQGSDPLTPPGHQSVDQYQAYDALCFAIAFVPKSFLGFVSLVVAVGDALYLGTSDRHQSYWANEGPGDPIQGLVRIANAQMYPAPTVLVWPAPGSRENNMVIEVSPPRGTARLDAQEVRRYLSIDRSDTPERAPQQQFTRLGDILDLPWKPVDRAFSEFPVNYGGAEIGRLLVKAAHQPVSIVGRHRVEKFMLALAPALQGRIEKDLLDVIAQQFAQTQDRDARKVASIIAASLTRFFGPTKVRLNVDLGFVLLEEQAVSDPQPTSEETNPVICPLEIARGQSFGTATLTVPAALRADHPAFFLVHSDPILDSLGKLLSARLLDAIRGELDDRLDALQDALGDVETSEGILSLLDTALSSFGISVSGLDIEPTTPPPPVAVGGGALRPSLPPSRPRRIQVTSLTEESACSMLSLPIRGPLQWIVRLKLRRETFTSELAPGTPWRAFFERLQDLLGSSLARVHTTREVRDLQRVASVAVSTGLIVHQMVNLALALSTTARVLHEQACLGALPVPEGDLRRLIAKHAASARELHGLVRALHAYAAFSAERPVALAKVLDRVERMFRSALQQRGIDLRVDCPPDVHGANLDLPFHIAGLALANLIENAKAAIAGDGRIVIEVTRQDRAIRCDVRDTGCGIDEALCQRIFELGVSTKPGNGGWGLYLTRKSLSEFGANVTLTITNTMGSTFTLTLPEKQSC